jgi:hypothetical protein
VAHPVLTNEELATESQLYNFRQYRGNTVSIGLVLKGGSPTTGLASFWLATGWKDYNPLKPSGNYIYHLL